MDPDEILLETEAAMEKGFEYMQHEFAAVRTGKASPALEFFSPLKGPNLEQICVAVGSGQMVPEEGAANYDKDVADLAQQLGLPAWS